MLRPVPMVRFRAQVPNRDAAVATRAIASEGLLHLVDIAHGRAPYDAAPPGVRELYAGFRDLTQRIRALSDRLGIPRTEPAGSIDGDDIADFAAERERIVLLLEPLEKSALELAKNESAARERLAAAKDAQRNAEIFRQADVDLDRLKSLKFATIRFGIADEDALNAVSAMLSPAPHSLMECGGGAAAFATPTSQQQRLDEALRLNSIEVIGTGRIACPTTDAEKQLEEARTAILEAKKKNGDVITDIAQRAEIATLLLQAQTYFAAAGRFIVISGWVPAASGEKLRERVRAATHGSAIIEIEPAEDVAGFAEGTVRIPILHRNPLLLRPFQKLIEIYGTPSYKEVEPTAFFAISFLLMFGLMFGDAGHGAVLFLAGWLLYRYLPRFLDYGILLMEAGVASIVFGFLYGTVFGIRGLIPTLWMEPIENLSRFMIVAIGFGIVVVTGGLLLNIVNAWRGGDVREALVGSKGITGTLLYWVVLVLLARAFVPASVRIPSSIVIALLAAVVVLLATAPFIVRAVGHHRPKPAVRATPWWLHALEAGVELVDTLFSFFANTISFVRIAAFAAVHAGICVAVFALADTIASFRFGGVLSVLVQIAGNALVILLEGLTVSVQVLRLEYYEFFGKFFRGGGETYAPLTLPARRRHA